MNGRHDEGPHEHDRGLSYDLPVLARRRMIRLMAGASLVPLVGCTTQEKTTASPSSSASPSSAGCAEIPEETADPFPGDGSNGVNVLKESGVVRSDITRSFGDSAGGTAEGIPLTITLTVVDAASGCGTPKQGAAVYLWHCDRDGAYSLYSEGVTEENYLRGVQETDEKGQVTFTSIFPGCYPGRWPHLHFEVYGSLADATAATSITNTSQLAFPEDVCEAVYATDGYGDSVRNLSSLSLEDGYTAALTVPV
jgi:protocatechuate 3,4-dioxygenase beta subunit